MAKVQVKQKPQVRRELAKKRAFVPEIELPQRENYIIMLIGVAVIILGYIVMINGDDVSPLSITIAPIILIIGYCVVIPFGLIYRRKATTEQGE